MILERVLKLSDQYEADMINIRRAIHRNPELSFHEFETSALVCRELKGMGIPFVMSPTEPGIIATIDSGKPGSLLMLRADMDALPIKESSGLEFSSKNDSVMHACGHDIHTANLLTVGRILNNTKELWRGRARLVFQPGEESGGGGRRMIETGLFDELPDACLGLHVFPWIQGRLVIGSGYLTAFSDGFTILVKGKAAHSSEPQQGVDAVNIAAAVITALNQVTARNLSPMSGSTLNVGLISGGSAPNVIADQVEMRGMIRNIRPEDREVMMRRITEISEGTAQTMGGACQCSFRTGYPSVLNDPALTKFVTETIDRDKDALYSGIGERPEHYLWGGNQAKLIAEDFGFYSQKVPSCFIQVGTGEFAPAHSPQFRVDEKYIKLCTRVMVCTAMEFLADL